MMGKIDPPKDEAEYRRAALDCALSFCPDIRPCKKCGWPYVKGYCCTYCKDKNPGEQNE